MVTPTEFAKAADPLLNNTDTQKTSQLTSLVKQAAKELTKVEFFEFSRLCGVTPHGTKKAAVQVFCDFVNRLAVMHTQIVT